MEEDAELQANDDTSRSPSLLSWVGWKREGTVEGFDRDFKNVRIGAPKTAVQRG